MTRARLWKNPPHGFLITAGLETGYKDSPANSNRPAVFKSVMVKDQTEANSPISNTFATSSFKLKKKTTAVNLTQTTGFINHKQSNLRLQPQLLSRLPSPPPSYHWSSTVHR